MVSQQRVGRHGNQYLLIAENGTGSAAGGTRWRTSVWPRVQRNSSQQSNTASTKKGRGSSSAKHAASSTPARDRIQSPIDSPPSRQQRSAEKRSKSSTSHLRPLAASAAGTGCPV